MIRSKKTFKIIYVLAFLISIAYALPLYVQSSFLEQFTDIKYVGLYITLATALSLLAIIIFPQFIKKYTNYRTMISVLVINILGTFFLIFSQHPLTILLFFSIHYVTITLLGINLDVFLEDITDNRNTGKIRTAYLTVVNTAILCAPISMGVIVGDNERYEATFIAAIIILIMAGLTLFIFRKHLNDHIHYKRRHLIELFGVIKNNINLGRVFILSFALRFFFAVMVLYTPLYLHENLDFSWKTIGVILTLMLAPYVLFELPAGKIADRYAGEKEMIIAGLFIMSIFTGTMFFITSTSVIVWTIILFMTRVGAALLESMHEVYFFKIIKREDVDIINLFRDTHPAGWLIGSALAVIILKFFPIHYLFLFFAIFIFLAIYPAWKLKDTK